MRKLLVSVFIIASFIGFSFYYRVRGQDDIALVPSKRLSFSPTSIPDTLTPTPQNSTDQNVPSSTPTPIPSSGFKDGTFTGDAADAFYGNIQVQISMQNGKIADVLFLQYPNDRGTSIEINQAAMPILKSEAIQAQSANVDIVSGATDSSQAFIQSLQSALDKAKI